MKRLTYRLEDQYGNPTDSIVLESDLISLNSSEKWKKVLSRLAAIEDILGDEYELDDLKTAMWCKETVGMAFSEDTDPVERLRELWFADKDGRCVVLPAKTVFELTWDSGPECDMACPVYIDGAGECSFCDKGKLFAYERPCKQEHIERVGEDVFLIRSEAEAALRREQE